MIHLFCFLESTKQSFCAQKFQSHAYLFVSRRPSIDVILCPCLYLFFLKLGKGYFEETTVKKIFAPHSPFDFFDESF